MSPEKLPAEVSARGGGQLRGRAITETAFVNVRDPGSGILVSGFLSERENAVDGHIPRRAV